MRINKQTIKLIPREVFQSKIRIGSPESYSILYGIDIFSFIIFRREIVLEYTTYDIFKTDEIALKIVSSNGLALRLGNAKQISNREIVLAAVKNNGAALQYAADIFKANFEICIAAVENCRYALQFVQRPIDGVATPCGDDDSYAQIVECAISNNLIAVKYVNWTRLPNVKKIKNAIRESMMKHQDFRSYSILKLYFDYFENDIELALRIIAKKPSFIRNLPEYFYNNYFAGRAIRINGFALKYFNMIPFKMDDILAAVKNNGRALCYAVGNQFHDREIVLSAVSNYGPALTYASDILKADEEIILAAALNSVYALDYAKNITYEILLKLAPKWGFSILRANAAIRELSNSQILCLYKKCINAEVVFLNDLLRLVNSAQRLIPMSIPLPNYIYRRLNIKRLE